MGQAKARGSFEERKAAAIVRKEEQEKVDLVARTVRDAKRREYRSQRKAEGKRPRRNPALVAVLGAAMMRMR